MIRDIANSAAGNAMQKMRSISTCCALFADTLIGSACPPLKHLAAIEVAPGFAPVNGEIWPENSTEVAPIFAPEVGHEEAELGFDLQEIATEVTAAIAPEAAEIGTHLEEIANKFAPGIAPEDAEIGLQNARAWQEIVAEEIYWQESLTEVAPGVASSATATEVAPAFAPLPVPPAPAKARARTSGKVMSKADQEEEEHNNRKKKRILLDLLNDRGYLLSSSSSKGPRPSSSKGSKGS